MLVIKSLAGVAFQLTLFATLLLLPAPTWDWPRALQFLTVYGIATTIAVFILARIAPRGLEARLAAPASASQPKEDRIVTWVLVLLFLAWFLFIPIDVFQLHLLPPPSPLLSILGAVVSIAGYGLCLASIYQNAFVAPIVKDQSERGHTLVDTGIYGIVRHPMYLGMLLWLIGLGLWLESTAGSIATIVLGQTFLLRIKIEEATLSNSLPGYVSYKLKVPYRLIPLIW